MAITTAQRTTPGPPQRPDSHPQPERPEPPRPAFPPPPQPLPAAAAGPVLDADPRTDPVLDRLLGERIIYLGGELHAAAADRIITQLLLLAAQDARRDITLYVNSTGGSVAAGWRARHDQVIARTSRPGPSGSPARWGTAADGRGGQAARPPARPDPALGDTAPDLASRRGLGGACGARWPSSSRGTRGGPSSRPSRTPPTIAGTPRRRPGLRAGGPRGRRLRPGNDNKPRVVAPEPEKRQQARAMLVPGALNVAHGPEPAQRHHGPERQRGERRSRPRETTTSPRNVVPGPEERQQARANVTSRGAGPHAPGPEPAPRRYRAGTTSSPRNVARGPGNRRLACSMSCWARERVARPATTLGLSARAGGERAGGGVIVIRAWG